MIELDSELKKLIALAETMDISCLILFGSRAKGTNNKFSDYDIAASGKDYVDFSLYAKYELDTCAEFDISNYDKASKSFKEEIDRTGVVIYEKI